MLAETTELADLQVFPWSASPLTDSNRRPPPYHGGSAPELSHLGNALGKALSLQISSFLRFAHPFLEGP
jgi:hypothetical protein